MDGDIILLEIARGTNVQKKKKSLKYYRESKISECIHPELTDIDTNLKKY